MQRLMTLLNWRPSSIRLAVGGFRVLWWMEQGMEKSQTCTECLVLDQWRNFFWHILRVYSERTRHQKFWRNPCRRIWYKGINFLCLESPRISNLQFFSNFVSTTFPLWYKGKLLESRLYVDLPILTIRQLQASHSSTRKTMPKRICNPSLLQIHTVVILALSQHQTLYDVRSGIRGVGTRLVEIASMRLVRDIGLGWAEEVHPCVPPAVSSRCWSIGDSCFQCIWSTVIAVTS